MSGALTANGREITPGELWALCSRQAELFSAGDSSSLPESTARELVEAVCFTLRMGQSQDASPAALMERGYRRLQAMTATGKLLWSRACLTAPKTENVFYRDTLKSIGVFFRRYDLRFFAHQIPCDIDYQLCLPVDEDMKGIEYVSEYLRRLLTENAVLRMFSPHEEDALLRELQPRYSQLAVNLCEPVLANAVGRTAAELGTDTILCSDSDRTAIKAVFLPLSDSQADELLYSSGQIVAKRAHLSRGADIDYVASAARSLRPRIMAALGAGDISGVFLSGK